jgi:hypothetical protein
VVVLIFGATCGWIAAVATTPVIGTVAAMVATASAGALLWSYGALSIRAGADGLHVGAAHLTRRYMGTVTALNRVEFRANLGPEADARAWLRTRPYVDGGVRVEVTDPADPVPYWLVSSRRPEAVAAALGQPVGQTET